MNNIGGYSPDYHDLDALFSMPISSASPGPSTIPKSRNSKKRALSEVRELAATSFSKKAKAEANNRYKDRKKRKRRRQRKIPVVADMSGSGLLPREIGVKHLEESGNNAHDASSVAEGVDTDSPRLSISEKGKGKASDSAPLTDAIQADQDLAVKKELLERHQILLSTLTQTLTCQVCLDLMRLPYALAPCGHLACYNCLVQWFTVGQDGVPAGMQTRRRKTCPHCRAVVRERPVEVWGIKSMVGAIAKSGLIESNLPAETAPIIQDRDPWAGIFHKQTVPWMALDEGMGVRDPEDGGIFRCLDCMHEIWDGVCSSCGREYAGHVGVGDEEGAWLDEEGDAWWRSWLGEDGSGSDDDNEENVNDDAVGQEEVIAAMHRILGRRYRGEHNEAPEDLEHDDAEGDGYESSFIDDEDDIGIPRVAARMGSVIDINSDSDDENEVEIQAARRPHRRRPVYDLSADSEDGTSSAAQYNGEDDIAALLSSSDAEDAEVPPQNARVNSGRRGRLRVVPSDDEDEVAEMDWQFKSAAPNSHIGDDDASVGSSDSDMLRGAAHEREIYGEDDSIAGPPAHLAHLFDMEDDEIEEQDEFYGDIDRDDDSRQDESDWEEY